ncbi:MAG: peptide chain release factor N(5)-glutamine methyltransferase [Oscillospiraceae bacterium]|jgi:release factor glutamine methyltransferase|nr:peptide chain release factor N(5)-glutamine methyltransferase [Oscillospiraceae bacterium]
MSAKSVAALRRWGKELLCKAEVENAVAECDWLLCHALGCTTTEMLLMETAASDSNARFTELINRRAAGEPVQYLLGKWDFYGLTFDVGEGVLIPRPETELLAQRAVEIASEIPTPVIVDLCAGTGCIGLTIARQVPQSQVWLVEKSSEAFAYLQQNAARFAATNTTLLQGDILTHDFCGIPPCDIICANPPYIPASKLLTLQREVRCEPAMALNGGADGLDFYRAIAASWTGGQRLRADTQRNRTPIKPGSTILLELGDGQYEAVAHMFKEKGFEVSAISDNAGHLRVLEARKKENT